MDSMRGSLLGPEFSDEQIAERLDAMSAHFTVHDKATLIERTVAALDQGEAVGLVLGSYGIRTTGAWRALDFGRARNPDMQRTLNLRSKQREIFRPFAPAVLAEDVTDYFELDDPSPYMLLVADVKRNRRQQMTPEQIRFFGIDKLNVTRSDIPAVTHAIRRGGSRLRP